MSPHQYHTVSFFKESCLFRPARRIAVSCETFDCFLRLSPADADLHFAQGRCFSCGALGHRAEKCGVRRRCERLVCSQLPDPYSMSFLPFLSSFLLTLCQCWTSIVTWGFDVGVVLDGKKIRWIRRDGGRQGVLRRRQTGLGEARMIGRCALRPR
jgi:hypothetical protein